MHRQSPFRRLYCLATLLLLSTAPQTARAEALLVVEADSGKVLQAENATHPWYPASVTKLMTTYVTLKAVKEGRITLDTVVTVSPVAAAQSPSKMGFRSGTQVTIDNALKMMMVKSANDMAVVLAEGVGGTVDGFSELMNANARRLGMSQTHYVNPNGLPAEGQVTSARDLVILARAIIRDLPEYEYFVHIPAIRFGRRVTPNFNRLIGRYPGADGMKTGFICASGFNLVASATRDGKRLIAVVLGAPSSQARAVRAMQLLEKGFSNNSLTWLRPSMGNVDNLVPMDVAPPNMRDEMCGGKRKRPASETEDDTVASNSTSSEAGAAFFVSALQAPMLKPTELLSLPAAAADPMIVYTGPKKTGADLIAAVAVEEQRQTVVKPKGRKARLAARKQEAGEAKEAAKETSAEAKTTAKPAKPVAGRVSVTIATDKPAKPASPKAGAAKPATAAKPVAASKPAAAAKRAAAPAADAGEPKPKPKPAAKPKAAAKPASEQKSAAAPPG